MIKLLKQLFAPKGKSVYGPRIFAHRTWLSRQVDEALYEQTRKRVLGID